LRFWKKPQKIQQNPPSDFPIGTFIKTEKAHYYIAGIDKRYLIISDRILRSWSPPRIVNTTEAAVGKYRVASRLRFRDGSLIHNLADGKIYLIVKGKRRQVMSPDVFRRIGGTVDDATTVSNKEIEMHEEGEPLS
jgi:hypothetical protein